MEGIRESQHSGEWGGVAVGGGAVPRRGRVHDERLMRGFEELSTPAVPKSLGVLCKRGAFRGASTHSPVPSFLIRRCSKLTCSGILRLPLLLWDGICPRPQPHP